MKSITQDLKFKFANFIIQQFLYELFFFVKVLRLKV